MNPRQEGLLDGGDFAERRSEEDLNAAIEWRGLPEFRPVTRDIRLVLSFDTVEERDALVEQIGVTISKKTGTTWSAWWPPRDREDLAALRFDFDAPEQGEPEPEMELSPEPEGEEVERDADAVNGAYGPQAAACGTETARDEIDEPPTPERAAIIRDPDPFEF